MKIQKREVCFLQNGTAISQIARLLTYECLFLSWCVPAFEQLRLSLSCLDSLILCKNVIRIVVFLGLGVWGACVYLLVREERCLFEVFFCYQIWGRFISSCDGLYMLRLLARNEISSQDDKTQEYCITEYYRCSDEGAIGLETCQCLRKLEKVFYLETTLLICHFLYLSDLLLILYYQGNLHKIGSMPFMSSCAPAAYSSLEVLILCGISPQSTLQ